MTRAVRFRKSEIENAALICREHGVAVKLAPDGSMLVFPNTHKPEAIDAPEAAPSPLQKWRETRDADKARGRAHGSQETR